MGDNGSSSDFSLEDGKLLIRLDERMKAMFREQKQFREEMQKAHHHLEESYKQRIIELEAEVKQIKSLVILARNGFVILIMLGAIVSWVVTTWDKIASRFGG